MQGCIAARWKDRYPSTSCSVSLKVIYLLCTILTVTMFLVTVICGSLSIIDSINASLILYMRFCLLRFLIFNFIQMISLLYLTL